MTSKGERTNPSLIEIVADAMVVTTNMDLTKCSHSISSEEDSGEGDGASCEFPTLGLRRAGSFPMTAPPKRPSRSSSLEGQMNLDSDGDEIDHQKFRQLLLGKQDADFLSNDELLVANANEDLEVSESNGLTLSPGFLKLHPRKSSCSAPPKIPHRASSINERATPRPTTSSNAFGRIHRDGSGGPQSGRKSLPSSVFRQTLRPDRRRRQRSFIQEMLDPDSEGCPKSLRLPPKLPSRSESEKSIDGSLRTLPTSGFGSAASAAESASTSQRSTASTDAPKRPRRSLSPIDAESIRSILGPSSTENTAVAAEVEPNQKIVATATRKRNLLGRAKTFSNHYANKDNCIAMLAKNWDVGQDLSGVPITKLDTAKLTIPHRKRVPPGRSQTFSFFAKPSQLDISPVSTQ